MATIKTHLVALVELYGGVVVIESVKTGSYD